MFYLKIRLFRDKLHNGAISSQNYRKFNVFLIMSKCVIISEVWVTVYFMCWKKSVIFLQLAKKEQETGRKKKERENEKNDS